MRFLLYNDSIITFKVITYIKVILHNQEFSIRFILITIKSEYMNFAIPRVTYIYKTTSTGGDTIWRKMCPK